VSKTKELKSVESKKRLMFTCCTTSHVYDTLSFGKRPKQGAFLETRSGGPNPNLGPLSKGLLVLSTLNHTPRIHMRRRRPSPGKRTHRS
jgi:hypothetical protein